MTAIDTITSPTALVIEGSALAIVAGVVILALRRRAIVDTRKLALTAGLAAVYTLFRLIPISRLIGISGSITAGGVIIPVIAIILEPQYGILSVFTGTLIASFAPWNPLKFAGLDFAPGAMNLLVANNLVRGRRIQAGIVLLSTIALFVLTPNTRVFVGSDLASPPLPYFWLHLVALVVLLSPVSKNALKWFQFRNYRELAVIIGVIAFAGTMTEHLTGAVLTGLFFGPGAVKIWPTAYILYPIERTIIVGGAIAICTPFVLRSRALLENISGRIHLTSRNDQLPK